MKKSKQGCDLKSCFLCNLSLKEWLPAVEANKQTLDYKKGEIIFNEGDVVKGIYFVYKGTVKIHKKWGTEKELIIRFAKDGDIFGHRGLGAETLYPISATALEETTVCFVSLDFFMSTLKVNSEFAVKMLLFYAEELQRSERKMNHLAHMQVKGRIAVALLTLKNKFGIAEDGSINILLSKQDLASYTGTTYETLFRFLNELSEAEIIKVANKNISIINEEALTQFTLETS